MAKTANPMPMPDADKANALLVSIMRDGKVFLGNDYVTGEALTQKVRDRLASRVKKTVFIRADARARYGLVVEAVDDVRAVGADQLGLLTDQKQRVAFP
jgi:biopolymer transport protein ExbD/biopolymer transport protein TolR